MRFSRLRRTPLLIISLVAGCGGGDGGAVLQPDPFTVADFVGSWHATAVVYTNNADAGQQLDVVTLGVTLDITVLTNGGVRTWLETPDSSDEWDALMTVSGSTLTLDPVEAGRPTQTHTFAFLSDDSFMLTNTGLEFDFTLSDATPVPATQVITFVRD